MPLRGQRGAELNLAKNRLLGVCLEEFGIEVGDRALFWKCVGETTVHVYVSGYNPGRGAGVRVGVGVPVVSLFVCVYRQLLQLRATGCLDPAAVPP